MSIKAVILSLPKDVDRRRSCEDELARLGLQYEFSDALAGDQLNETDLGRYYDADMNRSKFKRPLSANEVACALGHRQIWQAVAESEDHVVLVLEDDATFVQDPTAFLNALSKCSECFEDVMIKLDGVSGRNNQILKPLADQNLVLSDCLPPRTTGYILGRRAAAQLLRVHAPFARPVDIDLKFYWEHKVPILTLAEQMVAERGVFDSNIEACRTSKKSESSIGRFVRNLLYQIKYTYGRLSHPLKPEMIEGLGPLLRTDNTLRNRI